MNTMNKKKAILIFAAVAAALIVLAVILSLVFHKDYIEKTKFDHVSAVSYNGVRIVGRNGLFYLSKDGKIVSEGYVSLRSVNDGYAEDRADWSEADDALLFDYYIAHRPQNAQYLLVTAAGEEYVISGDNYSLAEIRLPYLIFINNTTGRRAALSLLRIDSDLSHKSGNELTLTPFSEVTPVRARAEDALYSHLEVRDDTRDVPYAVFTADGVQILATESYRKLLLSDGKERSAVYYVDDDTNTLYSSRGEVIAVGSAPVVTVSGEWGYLPYAAGEHAARAGVAVFSYQKSYRIENEAIDLAAARSFGGSLAFPVKDSTDVLLYTAVDGAQARYTSVEKRDNGLLYATLPDSTDTLYLTENGRLLLRSDHADAVLNTALSSETCFVFTRADYDGAHGADHHLHVAKEGKEAVTVTIDEGTTVTPLYTDDGSTRIEGVFLLASEKDGRPVYRLLSPFSPRLFSDAYDRIETFFTAGIVWSRGTSYTQKTYAFLDPIAGQIAATVNASDTDFAKLLFELADCDALLGDPYDRDSAVPILLLRLSCFEDDAVTSSIRYFALYRSLPASSTAFQEGTLRMLEVGKNLTRNAPISFFPTENAIVCHNTDFSHIYRLDDSDVLSEEVTLPYRVSDLLADSKDPSIHYFVVTSDDGKYGVYDREASCILPPYYDEIHSIDDGHFVVSLRGAQGVLSYEGGKLREVIDFRYSGVVALPDHGYLAVDGNGRTYLFEGKKKVADQAIQSYEGLTSYRMGEDGSIRVSYHVLLSMGGDLWIHESDREYRVRPMTYEKPTVTDWHIENERAVAVYYYHENAVVEVAVIYPTAVDRAAFALAAPPTGTGWYADPDADPETTAPLTEGDILAMGDHVVKVYTTNP